MTQRVLVVDDDPSVRLAHSRFVQQLGYEVESAADGVEALGKLALGIDLVLLDLYMPNMDGFEVTTRIRQHPTHGLVPIIIVTGSDKEAWYPRALEVGANDVLAKPINADELRLRTRWLLELKSSHDHLGEANARLTEAVERATASLRRALERATESERRIERAHLDTIKRLTIATEYKDDSIAGHLLRVGVSSGFLATAAGLESSEAEMIRHAAPMHDVGMIGIPDEILFKKGRLDAVELALIREHCRIGAALLADSDSPVIQMGARIALRHHEHWDGSGYPDGLVGADIPLEARICAVVDYYDSSTMDRPYRAALPSARVIATMREESGIRFDPELLDIFLTSLPELEELQRDLPPAWYPQT
ncbi:MAG: HD domain-containing phosphohydrolase [Gemmatimonadales bacterium]